MKNTFRRRYRKTLTLFGVDGTNINGYSSATGFHINVINGASNKERFSTPDDRERKNKLQIALGFAISVISFLLVYRWLNANELFTWWRYLSMSFIVSALLNIFLGAFDVARIRFSPSLRRFHGAEHRLVALLGSGAKITRESILATPSEHPNCGTRRIAKTITKDMPVNVLWVATALLIDPWYFTAPIAIAGALLWSIPGQRVAFSLSRLMQRHFTTATPGDTEIDAAVKLGAIIEDRYRYRMSSWMLHERDIPCLSWACYDCTLKRNSGQLKENTEPDAS